MACSWAAYILGDSLDANLDVHWALLLVFTHLDDALLA